VKKALLLTLIFAMTFLLNALDLAVGAQESLLLALGFVILAAYTFSEIGSAMTLPRVTGYILTGLLLGPFAFKILSNEMVQEIKIFNTLAIGLIAITAGLELHFSSLKKVISTIMGTTVLKIISLFLLVPATLFVVDQFTGMTGIESTMGLLALSTIFASLCIGTSPAIGLAVITETKAKGRMSQLILGSAIVKDVVVVVALALALGVAKPILAGAEGGSNFMHLMQELLLSILAGSILGLVFIGYIRFVGQEMFLFILAMILVTADLSQAVHLELLLVFIVAGVIVRNFSKQGEVLHHALEKVSLPVFVVFFTNVGAGLDLASTWKFLPLSAGLFFARALSFWLSNFLACYWNKEKPVIKNQTWLGYLPQAGVTLGLIGIAVQQIPEHTMVIENIGMGLVTLNLLIGPIVMRMALKSAGETASAMNSSEANEAIASEASKIESQGSKPTLDREEQSFDNTVKELAETLNDPRLRKEFLRSAQEVYNLFRRNQLLPQKNILSAFTNDLNTIDSLAGGQFVDKVDNHFQRLATKGKSIHNTLLQYQKCLEQSPSVFEVPLLDKHWKVQKKDPLFVKSSKLISYPKMWLSKDPIRRVPFRRCFRVAIEPFLSDFTVTTISSWYRLLGRHITTFQSTLEQEAFSEEDNQITENIAKENQLWVDSLNDDFVIGFKIVAKKWIHLLNTIDTPLLPDKDVRYSSVESLVKGSIEKSEAEALLWEEKFEFCRNRLKIIVNSAQLTSVLQQLLDKNYFAPVDLACDAIKELMGKVISFLDQLAGEISEIKEPNKEQFDKLFQSTKHFNDHELQAGVKSRFVQGNFKLLNREISLGIRKSMPKEEGTFEVSSAHTPPEKVSSPNEIIVKRVNLQELYVQNVFIDFLPFVEERIDGISNYIDSLLSEAEQAFSILSYTFQSRVGETTFSNEEYQEAIQSSLGTITNEKEKILNLLDDFLSYVEEAQKSTHDLALQSRESVQKGIDRISAVNHARQKIRMRTNYLRNGFLEQKNNIENRISSFYQQLKLGSQHLQERDLDINLKAKIKSKTLDATTIRRFIDETYRLNFESIQLPRVYQRLFSLDPILDRRFFIAHKGVWEHMEIFSRATVATGRQKILIVGDRGMGKTSLLNIAQLEIRCEKLLRIDTPPERSPISILARLLDAPNSKGGIMRKLRRQSTAIVIDNIDHWVNKLHLDEFHEFLQVVKDSPHNCHWLFSMTKDNFFRYEKAFGLKSTFSKILDLNSCTESVSKEVLRSRHRLSGLNADYPSTLISDYLDRLQLSEPGGLFIKSLHGRSKGNLRHLIYLWLKALGPSDGKSLPLNFDHSLSKGLPFFSEFSSFQKIMLAEIYKNHKINFKKLSQHLGATVPSITNEARYLGQAGLLLETPLGHAQAELDPTLTYLVGQGLRKEGILNGR